MDVPETIRSLVDRFERNRDDYRSPNYNEARLRREFIDPFFKALGWDVDNEQGYAEAYKDVIHEDSLRVENTAKAPDYCFRIGGQRKFFVEAKKPAVNIREDTSPAYQLRRYAWSARLPLSVLTDFEEFAVYDTRVKPEKSDKASTARVKFVKYTEYPDRWEEIAEVFSRDAILKGSFDKFAESMKKKRGTAQVDDAFLEEIESWREALARNIALRNSGLSPRDLNFAVQATIDRIVFLRICEGRGIEPYGALMAILNGPRVYPRLMELFGKADFRYNSGLFHFNRERGRVEPDTLTPGLTIDDTVLKGILKRLYYPESPYEFSMIPPDILGQVYERFLGKVIRLTPGGQAKVEDKPEVRKAGGVYYTPTYIVDYIVKHTVGKLLESYSGGRGSRRAVARGGRGSRRAVAHENGSPGGSPSRSGSPGGSPSHSGSPGGSPSQGSPSRKSAFQPPKLRVLDPACGSGSFLLGAYQYLLDWYLDAYINNEPDKLARKRKPPVYTDSHGDWRLTPSERKRILLDHIYGVDIDAQAVEVTKLSLLLKVLEGENEEAITNQLTLLHERALPDLDQNIKCGNSLIGPDFYDNVQMTMLDQEEQYRINVFDWKKEFPHVFKGDNPGFDAVIGNPPYAGFHEFTRHKEYLMRTYRSARGRFDYYIPFIERSLHLLRDSGFLGFICPSNLMKRSYGASIRALLLRETEVVSVCDFEDVQVFAGALNYTAVYVIKNQSPSAAHTLMYRTRSLLSEPTSVPQAALGTEPWVVRTPEAARVIDRLENPRNESLERIACAISEGIVTGKNSVFLLSAEVAGSLLLEPELVKPCVRGREIRRYCLANPQEVVIYPYVAQMALAVPLTEQELQRYPSVWKYLRARKNDLAGRAYFDRSKKSWYELWCPRDASQQQKRKIVVPELAESNRFAIATEDQFYGDTVCGITLGESRQEALEYLLGILNSRLLQFYYRQTTVPKANAYYIYKTMFLRNMPVRPVDFSDPADRKRHDRMVELVDHMLDLHKKLQDAKTPHEKETLQRQIEATDRQIDLLVYELYDLTEEEIKIVEGGDEQGTTGESSYP